MKTTIGKIACVPLAALCLLGTPQTTSAGNANAALGLAAGLFAGAVIAVAATTPCESTVYVAPPPPPPPPRHIHHAPPPPPPRHIHHAPPPPPPPHHHTHRAPPPPRAPKPPAPPHKPHRRGR